MTPREILWHLSFADGRQLIAWNRWTEGAKLAWGDSTPKHDWLR